MKKIRYSPDEDALLIQISAQKVDHAEEAGDFVLHYSEAGELVLIEVFHATRFLLSLLSSMIKQEEAALT